MRFGFNTMFAAIVAAVCVASCGGGSGGSIAPPPGPGTPPPPGPPPTPITVATTPVFGNVSMLQPVLLLQAPGDASRWFVVEQQGVVRTFPNNPNVSDVTVFADIRGRVLDGGERGLLGMAFHPDFGNGNFDVFLSYTSTNAGESVINRCRCFENG